MPIDEQQRGSVAYRKNKDAIWRGEVPAKYTRLLPHIPGHKILEIGSAEGVLAMLLAQSGCEVTALERRQDRHDEACKLQKTWAAMGRNVSGCQMLMGDIRDRYDLFDGIDTLVAVRCIYYLRGDISAVFAEAANRGVPKIVLCGNKNRSARYFSGDTTHPDNLGRFNYFASVKGMSEVLTYAGYRIFDTVTEGDPIVVGQHRSRSGI